MRVRKMNGEISVENREGNLHEMEERNEEFFQKGCIQKELDHIKQTELWDCGIACCAMVKRKKNIL